MSTAATWAAITAALWAYYLWSCFRHPYIPCRTCKGKGRHFDPMFKRAFRPCHACNGGGQKRRIGAVILRRGTRSTRGRRRPPRTKPKST